MAWNMEPKRSPPPGFRMRKGKGKSKKESRNFLLSVARALSPTWLMLEAVVALLSSVLKLEEEEAADPEAF
jgi:hypothetical protein